MKKPSVSKNTDFKSLFIVSVLLIISIILRTPGLFDSFWLDEAAQALESVRPLNQQLQIIPDFQPPLLHLITHFAAQVSTSEWWLRIFGALIPGIVTIMATYKLASKNFDKKTGFLAALLLATSSFHIFYSQELRPYSLMTMWAVLGWLCLLEDGKNQNAKLKWFKFFIISTLGLYSSYLYPFLLIGQILYLLLIKNLNRYAILSVLASSISFLFWLPIFFNQLKAGQLLRTSMPGWAEVVSTPQLKALFLLVGKLFYGVINLELNTFFIMLSSLAILLFLISLIKQIQQKQISKQQLTLFFCWLIFPTLFSWLISFFVPVIQPKRLMFILPAAYLFIALVSHAQYQVKSKLPFWQIRAAAEYPGRFLLALVFAVNVFSTYSLFTNPNYQRENWRDLNVEISKRFTPENTIVVNAFTEPFSPWVWYDKSKFPTYSTGTYNLESSKKIVQDLKQITNYDYVLVFDYLRDLTDPNDLLLQEIEAFGYKGIGVIDYPNIGFVRIYVKPNTSVS